MLRIFRGWGLSRRSARETRKCLNLVTERQYGMRCRARCVKTRTSSSWARTSPRWAARWASRREWSTSSGMSPVAEIMYEDFLTLATEQIVNQAAKHRYMSGGQLTVPVTFRTQGGAGWSPGAQHAQQLESWFVHIPGLKVVFASTPTDVRGLLWSSIYDDNPVV